MSNLVNKLKQTHVQWLDLYDPRRSMTDEEILNKYIDLSSSYMNPEEKNTLMNIIQSHKLLVSWMK